MLSRLSILPRSYKLYSSIFKLQHQVIKFSTKNVIHNDPLPVPKLIREHGFKVETHKVLTDDGYLLSLHRIPNHGKPPVLVNHGMFGSSSLFIVNGPKDALAYELHRSGFDVWMGNYRGNMYSKQHISLNNKQHKFWQFGFHEMGIYDLPAEIDYILNETQKLKLNYIGYSLGTLYYWILMSEKPEYNKKINQMHALAPMAYWGTESTEKSIEIKLASYVVELFKLLNIGETFENKKLHKVLAKSCDTPLLLKLCYAICVRIYAPSTKYVNPNILPLVLVNVPAGISTRTIEHSLQLFDTGKFRQYDYGSEEENLKMYHKPEPPDYILNNVTSPVYIHYSPNDVIALPKNVERLCDELNNCKERYFVPDSGFGHSDFVFGSTAKLLVYNHLINTMKRSKPFKKQK